MCTHAVPNECNVCTVTRDQGDDVKMMICLELWLMDAQFSVCPIDDVKKEFQAKKQLEDDFEMQRRHKRKVHHRWKEIREK